MWFVRTYFQNVPHFFGYQIMILQLCLIALVLGCSIVVDEVATVICVLDVTGSLLLPVSQSSSPLFEFCNQDIVVSGTFTNALNTNSIHTPKHMKESTNAKEAQEVMNNHMTILAKRYTQVMYFSETFHERDM